MLTDRGLISLSQFVAVQKQESRVLMLQKCGIVGVEIESGPTTVTEVLTWLRPVSPSQVEELVLEICHSTRMLRAAVSPKYIYDERWPDLGRGLLLDAYHVTGDHSTGYSVVAVDPTIAASAPLDDDLTNELNQSDLADREKIIRLMKSSAEGFRLQPQDFNGSLTSARVSLETLTRTLPRSAKQQSQCQVTRPNSEL